VINEIDNDVFVDRFSERERILRDISIHNDCEDDARRDAREAVKEAL
jgi:hypothetical protein